MKATQDSRSNRLSLSQVVDRLAASPSVDGIALFGSRTGPVKSPASDIDLLILVKSVPAPIFQMFTYIDGIMTDVLWVETELADRALVQSDQIEPASFEGMFAMKMASAQILYDPSGRLQQVQASLRQDNQVSDRLQPSSYSSIYAAWFWHNHTLMHVKRLVQSSDPVYQTAADMMMLTGLSTICRAYFTVRSIPWQGEKSAIRYLAAYDPDFLAQFRQALAAPFGEQKVELYASLVRKALAPAGEVWQPGITAVYLRDPERHATDVGAALQLWEGFFPP